MLQGTADSRKSSSVISRRVVVGRHASNASTDGAFVKAMRSTRRSHRSEGSEEKLPSSIAGSR